MELLMVLGFCCKKCGHEGNKKNPLTFDCIEPRGDEHHKYDTSHRMCFYWREHRAGNVQILCSICNSKKAAIDDAICPF
jgi:hypothetical protein